MIPRNPVLAYLHIPFCDSKCHYCAFNSYDTKSTLKKAYMSAINDQLRFELEQNAIEKQSIRSLFIGGGTPSCIEAAWYEPFFALITPYLTPDAEITTEANPHSATLSWLQTMHTLGVNRISFGVQSFHAQKLAFLGRNHTPATAIRAVENAFNAGIRNLSVDLIYATAYDTEALLNEDLRIACSLPINHISAYALTLEENTPFFGRNETTNPSEELARAFVASIVKAGFPQYEISNFGRYQSRHNTGYWLHENYMGIGAGAVGFFDDRRFYPPSEIEAYVQNPLERRTEMLSLEDLHVEKIFLGLRSKVGVLTSLLSQRERENAAILLHEKKLVQNNDRLFNQDYFLSDELALFLTR